MKVKYLMEILNRYNPDADITICVNGMPKEFEICIGGSEGCTDSNCDSVDFLIDTSSENVQGGTDMKYYWFEFADGYKCCVRGMSTQELRVEESKHGKLLRKIEA